MEEKNKKDFYRLLCLLFGVLLGAMLFVVLTDPFYQYHAPLGKIPVIMESAVYQTAGAARNLDYRDAIVGTSMTENFHTSWFDTQMGWHTMKLSYSGAGSDDLRAIFSQVFFGDRQIQHVLMDLNDYQLAATPDKSSFVERPEYLYDNKIWNDWEYLLNREVLEIGCERLMDWAAGTKDNVDSAYTWEEEELFGEEIAKSTAREYRDLFVNGILETPKEKQENFEEELRICQENLDRFLPYIRENPDTEFLLFFPPYSMLYWEQKVLEGKVESAFAVNQYVIEELLQYENVQIYYFQDERGMITNLDNFRDACHHRPEYNYYIFECIRDGKKKLTADCADEVLGEFYQYVKNFDYSVYWED